MRVLMALRGCRFFRMMASRTAATKFIQSISAPSRPGEHTISLRTFDTSGNIGTLSVTCAAEARYARNALLCAFLRHLYFAR